MATPLSVCAERDPKGFYARASVGEISSFTGFDHPYEAPEAPDVVVGHHLPLAEAADRVLAALGSEDPVRSRHS